jgi:hypothetical protein
MCTVLLPPGVNPIAVNKYIISYHIKFRATLSAEAHKFFQKSSGHIILLGTRRVTQQVSSTNIRGHLKKIVNKERWRHGFMHFRLNVTARLDVTFGLRFGQMYLNAEWRKSHLTLQSVR